MRQSLREVADHSLFLRVILLGQESYIVIELEKAFEEPSRLVFPPDEVEACNHPVAARKKRSLTAGKPIGGFFGLVPEDEAIFGQSFADSVDCTDDFWVILRQKADHSDA